MDTVWFKRRMKDIGLTQDELGARLGRDRSSTSKLLSGGVQVKVRQVPVLADALQVTIPEMLRRLGIDLGPMDQRPMNDAASRTASAQKPVLGIDRATLRYAFEKVLLNFVDEADGTLEPVDIDGLFDRVWRTYETVDEKGQKILA